MDCREQRYLQALQRNSAEKLQSTGLPLLSKILFTLSRRAKPIAQGVTHNPATLQRSGWRVYKWTEKGSLDLGWFVLSSASPTRPCITQVSTRFLSSEILGNPQNPPMGRLAPICSWLFAWMHMYGHATTSSPTVTWSWEQIHSFPHQLKLTFSARSGHASRMPVWWLPWQSILHLKRQFHENLNAGKNRCLVAAALASDRDLLTPRYCLHFVSASD